MNFNTIMAFIHPVGRTLGALALALFFSAPVSANKLGIWPIDPVVKPKESTAKIQVKNLDLAEPMRVQASVKRWEHINGEDVLTDQPDIVISPPQIEIAPGVEQLFRVIVRNRKSDGDNEITYRVFLDVIPNDKKNNSNSHLNLAMRYSLPLYLQAISSDPKNKKQIRTVEEAVGYKVLQGAKPEIEINNTSPWTQRLSRAEIRNSNNEKIADLSSGLWGYVLPQSQRRFPISTQNSKALTDPNNHLVYVTSDKEYRIDAK